MHTPQLHTPHLADVAGPVIEKVSPAIGKVAPAIGHARDEVIDHIRAAHVPGALVDRLPDRLTDHLPVADSRAKGRRTKRVLAVAFVGALGALAGWLAMKRGGAAVQPQHSAPDSRRPASGFEKKDQQATGAPGGSGGYADRGADDGFGGAAIGGATEASEGPYGAGSADPAPDGSAPGAAYTIKGDATAKVFHTRESPAYDGAKADVWFSDTVTAESAGFTSWDDK